MLNKSKKAIGTKKTLVGDFESRTSGCSASSLKHVSFWSHIFVYGTSIALLLAFTKVIQMSIAVMFFAAPLIVPIVITLAIILPFLFGKAATNRPVLKVGAIEKANRLFIFVDKTFFALAIAVPVIWIALLFGVAAFNSINK